MPSAALVEDSPSAESLEDPGRPTEDSEPASPVSEVGDTLPPPVARWVGDGAMQDEPLTPHLPDVAPLRVASPQSPAVTEQRPETGFGEWCPVRAAVTELGLI